MLYLTVDKKFCLFKSWSCEMKYMEHFDIRRIILLHLSNRVGFVTLKTISTNDGHVAKYAHHRSSCVAFAFVNQPENLRQAPKHLSAMSLRWCLWFRRFSKWTQEKFWGYFNFSIRLGGKGARIHGAENSRRYHLLHILLCSRTQSFQSHVIHILSIHYFNNKTEKPSDFFQVEWSCGPNQPQLIEAENLL